MPERYLILAGTEKSGTTSVFLYLNAHPDIAGSAHKETDYFRGEGRLDLAGYEAQFPGASADQVRMEASPGYLADSAVAAPAMASVVPEARLLFILRDPIHRLLSGFQFHKSRFHIPEAMSFDDYIGLCIRFERGEIGPDAAGLKTWHLRVPEAGRYALHLRDYYARFPREQIKVMTLDALQRDARAFMRAVCGWADLDANFYDDFDFMRANATFSPRRAWLQRLGLRVNDRLEPFFNRRPDIKQRLLAMYKKLNQKPDDKPRMSDDTMQLLRRYYAEDVAELLRVVGDDVADARGWLGVRHAG
jgi:hypothetical protein